MTKEVDMARCEVCGNDYYLSFEVVTAGNQHIFDCFECAIQKLAPVCAHCGCKIIGHGLEAANTFFCCAHCARESGIHELSDHLGVREEKPPTTYAGSTGGHFN